MIRKAREHDCLDAIGLEKEFRKTARFKRRLFLEQSDLRNLAIACMATELGITYGTDAGAVPRKMFEKLASIAEEKNLNGEEGSEPAFDKDNFSRDRMTNFGYTFRMAVMILDKDGKKGSIAEIAEKTYGGKATPYNASLYSVGFRELKKKLNESKGLEDLKVALNEFASKSSELGNYSLIPNRLPSACAKKVSLNSLKGGWGKGLRVKDKTGNEYRVNDQFALFAAWVDEKEKDLSDEDKAIVEQWKSTMLLKGDVWNLYKKAAKVYFRVFAQENPKKRLAALAKYLELVNDAIALRTNAIIEKCKVK